MNPENIVGLIAGILTSASMIPQLVKVIREKSAGDISVLMLCVLITGLALWVWYGFSREDFPIIVTNSFAVLLNGTLLVFALRYRDKSSAK